MTMHPQHKSGSKFRLESYRFVFSTLRQADSAVIPVRALEIVLLHFLFVLLVQLQNAWSSDVSLLDTIPAQFDNYLVSVAFGFAYIVLRRSKWTVGLFYLLYFFSLMAILLNQVHYKIFHEQLTLFQTETITLGNFHAIWDSFFAEFESAQIINLSTIVIAVIYATAAGAQVQGRSLTLMPSGRPRLLLLLLPAILFAYFQYGRDLDRQAKTINSHLFVAAWSGFGSTVGVDAPEISISPDSFYRLKFGKKRDDPAENRALTENLQTLQERKKNVIFIILESVGSKQFLRNGTPVKEVTPFLYGQKDNSIIFSDLHNTFPASTRSHVALATGGLTVTWGSVFDQLEYPYAGQTLVSAFAQDGRSTALFSADNLNFENINKFYRNLGFDLIYDPTSETNEFRSQNSIHSWGIDEKVVVDKAIPWMKAAKKPFFLNLLTITTHHPYGAPSTFSSRFQDTDNLSKYKTAVSYIDSIIASIVKQLEESNLAKDTLLFIVGDHGEAFGDLHKNNFVHKNYLYEENIRNFLMIVDLEKRIVPISSKRRGSVADVMPTILATQGIALDDHVIGQNLLSETYLEKITYFHKSSEPEQWGLRDGEWKFISGINDGSRPELYNLEDDPDEVKNLADKHKERADIYVNMISNWTVHMDAEFTKRLRGFHYGDDKATSVADFGAPGPKRIAVGRKPEGLPFFPIKGPIHPEEELTVATEGLAYTADVQMEYITTSPSGMTSSQFFKHLGGWTKTYLRLATNQPREEGLWKVELRAENKKIISSEFTVSTDAKLRWSFYDKTPGIRELYFGVKQSSGDFEVLKRINPMEKMAVLSRGIPFGTDKTVRYTWISPSGKFKSIEFEYQANWRTAWVFHNPEGPMEVGVWRVALFHRGKLLSVGSFEVSEDAPLHTPKKITARQTDKP
jgi:phosphoglycerol transferase MdoB-like AlkP superfamily enzyme